MVVYYQYPGCVHKAPNICASKLLLIPFLRDKFICINLLKVFKHHFHADSYKLAHIEVLFGIYRTEVEYKKSVWMIWKDWTHPERKQRLLKYNREDVINMMRLWIRVRNHFGIQNSYLIQEKLK